VSAPAAARQLHRGRLVLGVLLLLLATASLLQQADVVSLHLRYLAPALLVVAGVVLLVSGAVRDADGRGARR
jgi:uncharacterized membrane protein YbhN (UPF0104 family)